MYGYQPPEQNPSGSWREVLLITRIVFGLLLKPILALVGVLGLLGLIFVLFAVHPALALIPLAILVAGTMLLVRRDRREQEAMEEDIFGTRRP